MFTAIILVVLLGATGLSFDIGNLTVHKTALQAVADAAAMDSRFALADGTGSCALALQLADESATNNGLAYSAPGNSVSVTLGTVTSVDNVETFTPDPVSCANGDPAQATATAVQVHVAGTVPYFFSPGSGTPSATATWTSVPPMTGVRVGSYLANLDPSATLLNGFLGGLLGPPNTSNIQAVGYDGLASGGVTLGQLATALSVGTPRQALADNITYGQLITATISALTNNPSDPGASAALAALQTLNSEVAFSTATTFSLGKLVSLSSPGDGNAAATAVDVLDLVMGGAELENGQNFYASNLGITLPSTLATTLDSLGLLNAQVVSVNTSVAAIQAAQTAYGPVGTSVSTAQVVVETTATVSAQVNVGLLSLADVTFTVPLSFNLAGATGTITSISCASGDPVTISTSSNLAGEYLGPASISGNAVVVPAAAPLVALSVLGLSAGASGSLTATLLPTTQVFTFTGPFSSTTGLRSRGGHNAQDQPSLYPAVNVSLTATGSTAVVVPVSLFDTVVNSISASLVSAMNPVLVNLGIEVGGAVTDNVAYPGSPGVTCANGQLF